MALLLEFYGWILTTSAMAAVLALMILLVKRIWKDRLSPHWHYALWLLLIARLILPWSPESSLSVYNWLLFNVHDSLHRDLQFKQAGVIEGSGWHMIGGKEVREGSAAVSEEAPVFAEPQNDPAPSAFTFSALREWLAEDTVFRLSFLVWMIGVISLGGYLAFSMGRTVLLARRSSLVTDGLAAEQLEYCRRMMSVKKPLPLMKSENIATPTLYGLFRPRILLSEQTLQLLEPKEFSYVFFHELAHYKRKDIPVNCLLTVLLVLHWFNPLLWYSFARMRADQEIACDAYALSYIGRKESSAYGHTVIKLLEHAAKRRTLLTTAGFMGSRSKLRQRIDMIKGFGKPSRRWPFLGLSFILLLGCTALTNAKSPADGQHSGGKTQQSLSSSSQDGKNMSEVTLEDTEFLQLGMIDPASGWAVANGNVYRTQNGGRTWLNVTPEDFPQSREGSPAIYRAHFADANTAYVAASEEEKGQITVFFTKDGGSTWQQRKLKGGWGSSLPRVAAIDFVDAQHGWLMLEFGVAAGSQPVAVYRTTDGGSHWEYAAGYDGKNPESEGIPPGGLKTGMAFADAQRGWITGLDDGNRLYLYATEDGGVRWKRQVLSVPEGFRAEGGSASTFPPLFFSAKEGVLPVVFHGQKQAAIFYRTRDGGTTWSYAGAVPVVTEGSASFIWDFLDGSRGFVADGKALFATRDGGGSWKKIDYPGGLKDIRQLDFVTEQTGWALGEGFMLNTADGGKTWMKISGSAPDVTKSLSVLSPEIERIVDLAEKGTVEGSPFAAAASTMDQVRKEWGKPNSISAAGRGKYATYAKWDVVFGYNKNGEIFDVRSYSPELNQITYSEVKEAMGEPHMLRYYQDENYDQDILVYQLNEKFQLKWIFPKPGLEQPDPGVHHISVFYEAGADNDADAGNEVSTGNNEQE